MSPRAIRHRNLACFAGVIAAGAVFASGCSSSGESASSHRAVVASVSGAAGGLLDGRSAEAPGRPAGVLAGKVVGIDPGHNGRNYADPAFINHLIWNGREEETCDTTGTETDGGYTEAHFNWNVARYLTADLRTEGAKVVLTRRSNDGVGPCVTTRVADHQPRPRERRDRHPRRRRAAGGPRLRDPRARRRRPQQPGDRRLEGVRQGAAPALPGGHRHARDQPTTASTGSPIATTSPAST